MSASNKSYGLGIDAGGTETRWALADAGNVIIATGSVAGLTALLMATEGGRARMRDVMASIAGTLPVTQWPEKVCAGMTGFSDGGDDIRRLIATAFKIDQSGVALHSDIEIACLDLFAPGGGYVVYAGTGSIAAFIDADGKFHRAGGHGVMLDDAGGGHWIAIEALQHIWRNEDEKPGLWRTSPMAAAMFEMLGGEDWSRTREFVYHRERGEIGKLALVVAAMASDDPAAMDILRRAGRELARLGNAMISRYGPRPIALTGRVVQLHPVIEQSMRAALPSTTELTVRTGEAHIAAARIAAAGIAAAQIASRRTQPIFGENE